MSNLEVVNPCLTDNLEAKVTVHKMGMKYCKRKILRSRKFLLKVVISFPVIRENQEKNEIMKGGVWRDPAALQLPLTDF